MNLLGKLPDNGSNFVEAFTIIHHPFDRSSSPSCAEEATMPSYCRRPNKI